ncbi:MAG: ABC transporter substrate-binding protein, partial [Acidobacteriota bacterium]
ERALRDAERGAQLWADADPRGPEDVLEHAELCLLAAEIHWQGRRMDSVRTWVDRGLAPAAAAGAVDLLRRLLQLGIAVDSLRGSRADAEFLRRLRELEGGRGGPSDPMPGGHLVSGLTLPIRHLEPAEVLTLEEWEVALQMYECLVVAAGEGVPGGGLAETWTVSEDGTRFQFDLRRGLRFSDGSPLDAVAVRESLEHAARRTVADPTRPLPPALAPLLGIQDFLDGRSERIEGIEAHRQPEGRDRIVIHLTEALPIFPALLTDLRTAVVRPRDSALSLGTGPFRLDSRTASRCELVPNPEWRGTPPWLERLVVETFDGAGPLAKAAREGRVDLAHDLLPNDFETLGQSPRFKAGVLEAVKKNTYFAVLRGDSPRMTPQVRRALAGVVRTPDLVWRSLGRFAVPAVSLIPPGMLGHDAGRRRPSLATERARELLVASGVQLPLHLDALVHPLFFARLAPFLEALRAEWAAVGVELRAEPRSISEFLSLQRADAPPFDLVLSRWNAAYDDPDNFTFSLLDSELGLVRSFFSSPQADQLMRRARTEPAAADRRRLYRQLEDLVADEGLLVPLFHDVDTRLLAQGWRGLELRDATGYPSYGQVHRAPASPQPSVPSRGGELRVATPMILDTLDPAAGYFVHHHEQTLNIFETLVRIDAGARPKPWLAESLEILEGGRIFHFALRKGLRFHDGRLLTPRDVRYSFERLLRNSDLAAGALLKPIQGAGDFIRGQADSLAGFHIRSSLDLAIELDHPLAFFPTLLAHPCLAIVPEDVGPLDRRWQAGACGTGPFRIAGFAPGERLELERNPSYWRPGFPKTERLVFVHEPDPSKRLQAFRQGRVSVAADLRPEDAHALRREPQRVGEYRESPSLSTYFLGLCARRGPLSDPQARAALAASLDVDTLVRRTLGRSGVRARGLVPPGLLGWDTPMAEPEAAPAPSDVLDGTHLVMVQHPIFRRCFEAFAQRLEKQLRALGLELEIRTVDDVTEIQRLAAGDDVDLILSRWMSVYPDPDCLVSGLLHPRDGFLSPLCGSRELARLVEDGRRETDPALRHGIYRHLEETLAREHRVVPLFHEQSCRFSFPGVRGLRLGITTPEVRYDELMVGQDSGPA